MPHDDFLLKRLREVRDLTCPDRGAMLQTLCEDFWERIERDPPLPTDTVDHFVQLLQRDEDLVLARLVVPDLRISSDNQNPIQRQILNRIAPQRSSIQFFNQPIHDHDTTQARRLYTEETRIMQEVDMYRASILLFNRGNLNLSQRDELREWLDRGAEISKKWERP
jgi:hypothetical protein